MGGVIELIIYEEPTLLLGIWQMLNNILPLPFYNPLLYQCLKACWKNKARLIQIFFPREFRKATALV